MTTRADYTDEQWHRLMSLPGLVGVAVAGLERGLLAFPKAMVALGAFYVEAKDKYKDNELVQAALAYQGPDLPGAEEPAPRLPNRVDLSPEAWREFIEQSLDAVGDDPVEREYKQFVYAVAERVAGAAGGGLLGSKPQVSEREARFLENLKERLGLA